jgi:hypothetical protein
VKLSNGSDILVRMSRGDINMPNYDDFHLHTQVLDFEFEAAEYELLHFESNIRASRLHYYRVPAQNGSSSQHDVPREFQDVACFFRKGRRGK